MLIESAFLKLPELMLSNLTNRGNVEAMVVHHLVTGLQMEMNSRSVPFAYNHITVEKPYPNQKQSGTVFRADLLFESNGCIPDAARLEQYGLRDKQWLEAKTFFSKGKTKPASTQNIGRIVKDLIRLCLLPEECPGKIRQNGRYALLVFDKHPSKYLAYSDRIWVEKLFDGRTASISINLTSERASLINSIVRSSSINSQIDLSLSVTHFEPSSETPFPIYWGYLIRIDKYSIAINGKAIQSNGEFKEYWDHDKILLLNDVKNEFISQLKNDEDDLTVDPDQI